MADDAWRLHRREGVYHDVGRGERWETSGTRTGFAAPVLAGFERGRAAKPVRVPSVCVKLRRKSRYSRGGDSDPVSGPNVMVWGERVVPETGWLSPIGVGQACRAGNGMAECGSVGVRAGSGTRTGFAAPVLAGFERGRAAKPVRVPSRRAGSSGSGAMMEEQEGTAILFPARMLWRRASASCRKQDGCPQWGLTNAQIGSNSHSRCSTPRDAKRSGRMHCVCR